MITLNLTREEALMLRNLMSDTVCEYEWMQEIADGLKKKSEEVCVKPQITRQEFNRRIGDVRTRWENKGLATSMMIAKEAELKFYYDIVEEDCENKGAGGRMGNKFCAKF